MKRSLAGLCFVAVLAVATNVSAGKGGKGTIETGRTVSFEYTLTVDGKMVDTSEGRSPFQYTHGQGTIIPGLSKQLEGLHEGDEKTIVVAPAEAYGPVDPKAFQEVPRARLPKELDLHIGTQLQASGPDGRMFVVTVSELKGENVILNFNHPLAGKTLQFQIKIVSIQ